MNRLPSTSFKIAIVPQTSVFGLAANSTPFAFRILAVAKTVYLTRAPRLAFLAAAVTFA
jgi:hypothetical protein